MFQEFGTNLVRPRLARPTWNLLCRWQLG